MAKPVMTGKQALQILANSDGEVPSHKHVESAMRGLIRLEAEERRARMLERSPLPSAAARSRTAGA